MTRHDLTITPDLDGERADRAIAVLLDIARSASRAAFDTGSVTLAGQPIRPSHRVVTGDRIVVVAEEHNRDIEADPLVPYDVVYEDEFLVVVDKPIGVVVHPTSVRSEGTLVHGLLDRYPTVRGVGADGRWGIVHRLDRDTSGLLVVALTPGVHRELSTMIRRREMSRRYLTLVRGRFDAVRGTVEAPMARDRSNPTRMRLDRSGRHAVTHYRRLATWGDPDVSLLGVSLETGRTHQIRVHMASIDHPIVGDAAYGVTGGPGDPGRPWLHARRLSFIHPVTDVPIDAVAPLPDDLADSLAAIGPPTVGSLEDAEDAT